MSIETEIIELEVRLEKLRLQLSTGFQTVEITDGDEYRIYDDHENIYDVVGNLAGIVIDQKLMTKYFDSNPYKA